MLFALLIYFILFKSCHMPFYRLCLVVIVRSIYVVVVGCYLAKPFVLAGGYFFVPLGTVSKLGPRVHLFCIAYQAMQEPSWFATAAEPIAA